MFVTRSVRAANATHLLNRRGNFGRESESFAGSLWGANATPRVRFAVRSLTIKTESAAVSACLFVSSFAIATYGTNKKNRLPPIAVNGWERIACEKLLNLPE